MLGDDASPATNDGYRPRATSGPRHAAPRKSLLTKLHVPAGKAVALAAMPTAVLMGMGLTPHLAQADEPKNPSFKPGPCVTQSDTPSPTASGKDAKADKTDKKSDKDSKDAKDDKAGADPSASPDAKADAKKPDPTSSPTADPSSTASGDTSKAPETKSTPAPSATPSPGSSYNPLDPLGLGSLLGGLLGGNKPPSGSGATTPPASPSPSPSTSASKPDPSPSGGSGSAASDAGKAAGDAEKTVKGTTDAAKKAAKGLGDATASASPSPSSSAGSAGSAGSDTAKADGKQSYPCPTYDAKALDDANLESGIPLLPDEPWTLKSSLLKLHGLNYDGIVQVKTASGAIKDVLKFTTTGIDIGDLDQLVVGPNGQGHIEVKAAKGSTSTITGGTTTLYTESLSGNLLGLVPITFTPKAPPPLTLPELFFTDVTVINAGQFGGNLHVPGMQVLPGQP